MPIRVAAFLFLACAPLLAQTRFDGTWKMTTYRSIPNGLRISDGGDSFEAKFDGKDYPLGRDWLTTVSLTLVDENTLQETDKHQGEIMTVSRMTVSRDGKTMAVESLDNQRGTTMTYTAEKLPSRTRK